MSTLEERESTKITNTLSFDIDNTDIKNFYEVMTGKRKNIPYIVLFKPIMKSKELNMTDAILYGVVYAIISAIIVSNGGTVNTFSINNTSCVITNEDISKWVDINKNSITNGFNKLEKYGFISIDYTDTGKNGSDKSGKSSKSGSGKFGKRIVTIKRDMMQYQKEEIKEIKKYCKKLKSNGAEEIRIDKSVVRLDDVIEICDRKIGKDKNKEIGVASNTGKKEGVVGVRGKKKEKEKTLKENIYLDEYDAIINEVGEF